MTCPSSIHDGEPAPEARFPGTFTNRWAPDRTERVTYCLRCAGLGVSIGIFTLDEPSAEVEAWIAANRRTT